MDQSEMEDDIREAVYNGHHGPRCVDLEKWKFCSGLHWKVQNFEQSGFSIGQIRKAYLEALAKVEQHEH